MNCQAENVLVEEKTLDSLLVDRYLAGDTALALSRQYGIEMLLLKDRLKTLLEPLGRRLRFEPLPGPQTDFMTDMRHRYIGFKAGWRSGKRLALDTPIPTPTGWTTMGELSVGDEVFDERGKPCTVTSLSPIVMGDSYCVLFTDGSEIIADAEHQWLTATEADRKSELRCAVAVGESRLGDKRSKRQNYPRVRTTAEIRSSTIITREHSTYHNHSIENTRPLILPHADDLPIAPYTLGAWLGDGTSRTAQITVGDGDEETLANIIRDGFGIQENKSSNANSGLYRIVGLRNRLFKSGLLQNKHIPEKYFRASISQRLALLQGLMDTDGTFDGRQAIFYSTNERLADGAFELVVSLGMKATRRQKRAMLYEKYCGICHCVTFSPTMKVFKLSRKRNRIRFNLKRLATRSRRYIRSVEPVESVPMRCIAVDSPSHLYLAGRSMIPTHNSVCGAQKLSEMHMINAGFVSGEPFTPNNVKSLIVAQTYQMIQRVNLPQIIDAFDRIGLRTEPISDPKRSMIVIPELGTKRRPSEIYLCSAESPEKICGFEVGWVWCDEASRYTWSEDNPLNDAVVQADSRLSDARAKVRQMTFTFTPEGTATRMFRDFEMGWWDDNGFRRLGKYGHILYRARTSDNPHVGDYVQHQRRQLSPAQYKQFIDGETMENNSGRVFSSFSDDPETGNVDDTISIDPHVPLEIGVDFNVTMHCVVGQSFVQPKLVTSVYEISEKNMTIPQMVTAIANLCANVIGWKWSTALPLHIYGDPAGHARAGGKGESQWEVLMAYLRAQGIPFSLKCGRSHAAVSERVAHANAALRNAEGEVRWKIHSRCIGLLKDLKFLSWTGDGSIDKRDNERSHFAEGDTNRIFQLVPISKITIPPAGRVFTV